MLQLAVRTLMRLVRDSPGRIPDVLLERRAVGEAARACPPASVASDGYPFYSRILGPVRLLAPQDLDELREIAVSNMYCASGFTPRDGWTVVDVGANLGLFSLWARSFMSRGRIVAIEPISTNFRVLWDNLASALGGAKRAPVLVPLNVAISDRAETLDFLVPHGPLGWSAAAGWACAVGSSCAEFLDPQNVERACVRALPLDAVLGGLVPGQRPKVVDLLKVDVEGMEVQCLAGAQATLANTQRVVFEYHSPGLLSRSSDILRAAGMREVLRRCPYTGDIGLSFWARPRRARPSPVVIEQ